MDRKKNVPKIRFQNFEDEWLDSTIGRHISLLNGRAYKQEELLDEGKYKVLRVGNFNTNSKWYYSNLELEENKYVNKGDLIYLWATNFGPEIWTEEKAIYHYHIWKLEFDRTEINQDYLNIWLESDKNKIQQNTNGSTMVHITKTMMEERGISLPNFDEQSVIGSLFRTIDDLLTSYKDNLANYQSLKAAMLSKMFPKAGQTVPEIRLDGFEGEWEIKRADEIFKSVSKKNKALLPVLSASQIDGMVLRDEIGIDIKYDEATLNNYKVVKPGQFVIHLRSFQGGFALSKLEGITSPAYTIIDFIDKENHLPDFWNSILTSRDFIKRLETVTYGIRDGKSISFKDFSSLKFVFPNFKEQQAIGSYFSNLDNLINSNQEKISQLETLKKKLMQDMFV